MALVTQLWQIFGLCDLYSIGQNDTHPGTQGGYDYCVNCAQFVAQKIEVENNFDPFNEDFGNVYSGSLMNVFGPQPAPLPYSAKQRVSKKLEVPVLYNELMKIVSYKEVSQYMYLKSEINSILRKKDAETKAWNKIVNYKDYIICDADIGVRQVCFVLHCIVLFVCGV